MLRHLTCAAPTAGSLRVLSLDGCACQAKMMDENAEMQRLHLSRRRAAMGHSAPGQPAPCALHVHKPCRRTIPIQEYACTARGQSHCSLGSRRVCARTRTHVDAACVMSCGACDVLMLCRWPCSGLRRCAVRRRERARGGARRRSDGEAGRARAVESVAGWRQEASDRQPVCKDADDTGACGLLAEARSAHECTVPRARHVAT